MNSCQGATFRLREPERSAFYAAYYPDWEAVPFLRGRVALERNNTQVGVSAGLFQEKKKGACIYAKARNVLGGLQVCVRVKLPRLARSADGPVDAKLRMYVT